MGKLYSIVMLLDEQSQHVAIGCWTLHDCPAKLATCQPAHLMHHIPMHYMQMHYI